MKKLILSILSFLFCATLFAQHNVLFSQYMFNGLLLNPAYAGSNEVLSATAVDRIQWAGFDGAPKTLSVSLHSPLKNKKVNVGLSIVNDQMGSPIKIKLRAFMLTEYF